MFDACYNTRKPRPAHYRKKKKKKNDFAIALLTVLLTQILCLFTFMSFFL